MANPELMRHLISLVHLDIDAIHAYQLAIKEIDVQEVKDNLIKFKQDHQRHLDDLAPFIRSLGGEPPAFKPDFKGYFIKGFTALRSLTGTEGALKAMRSNEQLTNKTYEDALTWQMPDEIRSVIQKNRDDERRHLTYIEDIINQRVWEKKKIA
jgi:rubrerythrin